MNPFIELQKTIAVFFIALVCFGLPPASKAVNPPPDGGYPGLNTAEGQNALNNLTTGSSNTAVGWFSLFSNTGGSNNTAIGAGTLLFNVPNQFGGGVDNTAIGTAALLFNTTGGDNTANGAFALFSNTTGISNTADGFQALFSNTNGFQNIAVGDGALVQNIHGDRNTAIGELALADCTTCSNNIALGFLAGSSVLATNNIDIGNSGAAEDSFTIRIGDFANATFIAGISGTAVVGDNVVVDGNGQLGTLASSERFKKDIKPMDKSSEAILSLKPVRFQYKADSKGTPQFGLIAEEVAKVNPDLVVRDRNGEIYSVRYEAVNAMLLNEFLKEHRKNEEQQVIITRLQNQVEALTAGLQKVSAQIRLSKPAPQTVLNNQ